MAATRDFWSQMLNTTLRAVEVLYIVFYAHGDDTAAYVARLQLVMRRTQVYGIT